MCVYLRGGVIGEVRMCGWIVDCLFGAAYVLRDLSARGFGREPAACVCLSFGRIFVLRDPVHLLECKLWDGK